MKKMRIRVGDIRLEDAEKRILKEVIDSGRISEGKMVRKFEKRWAEFVGTKYCVVTSSGAGALIAGLTALKYFKNLKPGTKVITSPLTYIATSSAISVVGFEPVYVDVDLKTLNITPETIERYLNKLKNIDNHAVILPVHLMGYPLEMDKINKIAQKYGLITLEDAAQAHGTMCGESKAGSMSLLSTFSFYIAHNIQAGEMGAVNTDNQDIAKLVKKIKAQGRACDCLVCTRGNGWCPKVDAHDGEDDFDPRFTHDLIGYNFKTMEFQAALGLSQLEKVEWIIKRRQDNVRCLNNILGRYNDILQLPEYSEKISYLGYPMVIIRPNLISRKELRTKLEEAGIETRPLFGCIPTQQPAYAHLREQYKGQLPHAEYLGLNGFYIGCHQYLTEDDLGYIEKTFNEIIPLGEEKT